MEAKEGIKDSRSDNILKETSPHFLSLIHLFLFSQFQKYKGEKERQLCPNALNELYFCPSIQRLAITDAAVISDYATCA